MASEIDPSGAVTRYGYDQLGRRTTTLPPHPAGRAAIMQELDDQQAIYQGAWQVESGGAEGTYHAAAAVATTPATATWRFTGLPAGGRYELMATWEPRPGHTAWSEFSLTDPAAGTTQRVIVDQRQIQPDVVDGGRAWQRLGAVTAAGDSLEVTLQGAGTPGFLAADAVRLVEVVGATYARYDAQGNLVSYADAGGRAWRYAYDARAQRIAQMDAQGDTTHFQYDALGRLTGVMDPLGNATLFAYDERDRLTRESVTIDGVPYATTYQYDVRDKLTLAVDRAGRARRLRYDPLGRLQEEAWYERVSDARDDLARTNTIIRDYDAVGRLRSLADDASAYIQTYDALDRPVTTLVDLPGLPGVVLVSQYARDDELRAGLATWIGGTPDVENRYTYDAQARLQRVEQRGPAARSKQVAFQYTVWGQPARIERFEGDMGARVAVASVLTYDAQQRLTSLTHQQGTTVLAAYDYQYDPAGRVTRAVSAEDGPVDFHYDARGQLVAELGRDRSAVFYAYDANGNRADQEYVTGDDNRVESDGEFRYAYDPQGNRTRRTEIATGAVTEYRWDPLNRLTEVIDRASAEGPPLQTVVYAYDALGRRAGKTVRTASGPAETEQYIYDGEDILFRFVNGRLANRYLHGPLVDQVLADEQLAAETARATLLWPLADRLGTVRDLAIGDGPSGQTRVAQHLVYDAFGRRSDQTVAAVEHLFGFTGREYDEESGLSYYRARYYDPRLGRFLSEDPLGFAAGDMNLYRYVQNDPTNRTDPTGLYDQDVHFYMNYYLARYLGLDQPTDRMNSRGQPMSEALVIAYFATRPDYDARTQPIGAGVAARSRFHFPDPNDGQGVREGDSRVRAALLQHARRGMVELFGTLLHLYQDTFSHQGHGDVMGHAAAEAGGHAPDQPYRRPDLAQRMARDTYDAMVSLLLARRGVGPENGAGRAALLEGKSFEGFWARIRPTLLTVPQSGDARAFELERVTAWQNLIRADFRGAAPQFNDVEPEATTPMARYFRELSARIHRWY